MVNDVPFVGKNAERPSGPDEVTRAIITDSDELDSIISRVLLTAISTFRVLEGESLEHAVGRHAFVPTPKGTETSV